MRRRWSKGPKVLMEGTLDNPRLSVQTHGRRRDYSHDHSPLPMLRYPSCPMDSKQCPDHGTCSRPLASAIRRKVGCPTWNCLALQALLEIGGSPTAHRILPASIGLRLEIIMIAALARLDSMLPELSGSKGLVRGNSFRSSAGARLLLSHKFAKHLLRMKSTENKKKRLANSATGGSVPLQFPHVGKI